MAELTPIQTQVLAGLLAGGSVAAVAREHRIHRSTIYAWRNDHGAFGFALKDARRRQQASLYDGAQDLASRAFEALGALLASENDVVKLKAAQAILRTVLPSGVKDELENPQSNQEAILDRLDRTRALKALPAGYEMPGPTDYPDESAAIQQNPTLLVKAAA